MPSSQPVAAFWASALAGSTAPGRNPSGVIGSKFQLACCCCNDPSSPDTPGHLQRRGFDYSGGAWSLLDGRPGSHMLYSDGAGVRLEAEVAAGGGYTQALLIQAASLTRGTLRTTATLSKVGAQWQATGESMCCDRGTRLIATV